MPLLEVRNLIKKIGGIVAVNNLNMCCQEGDILGIIGPNGAGKTTFFNLLSGVLTPTDGQIFFKNRLINRLRPDQIAELGIARTFQLIRTFKNLSVLENVLLAVGHEFYPRISGMFARYLRTPYVNKAYHILDYTGLRGYETTLARNLPLGLQRRLELARALALDPDLLLLDEPTSGLSYEETQASMKLLRELNSARKTIILIEHNMKVAMELCPRIICLNYGQKIAEGTPEEITTNALVIKSYLGET